MKEVEGVGGRRGKGKGEEGETLVGGRGGRVKKREGNLLFYLNIIRPNYRPFKG